MPFTLVVNYQSGNFPPPTPVPSWSSRWPRRRLHNHLTLVPTPRSGQRSFFLLTLQCSATASYCGLRLRYLCSSLSAPATSAGYWTLSFSIWYSSLACVCLCGGALYGPCLTCALTISSSFSGPGTLTASLRACLRTDRPALLSCCISFTVSLLRHVAHRHETVRNLELH